MSSVAQPPPVRELELSGRFDLDDELGDFGRAVPARKAGRTAAHREAYSLRRLLLAWEQIGQLQRPLHIQREPDLFPDFKLQWNGDGRKELGVEVVEATEAETQAWLTKTRNEEAALLPGDGFVPNAQSQHVADVLRRAIAKKSEQYGGRGLGYPVDLLVYENENSDMGDPDVIIAKVTHDAELAAAARKVFAKVHIVVGSIVAIDAFGQPRIVDLKANYAHDFFAWTAEQADRLRSAAPSGVDSPHIAEEIESMGKSDKRALRAQLKRLLVHLLKWKFQPTHRGASWTSSISNARFELEGIAADSPSLAKQVPTFVSEIYSQAAREAAGEMGVDVGQLPAECPFTLDQIHDDEFLPE